MISSRSRIASKVDRYSRHCSCCSLDKVLISPRRDSLNIVAMIDSDRATLVFLILKWSSLDLATYSLMTAMWSLDGPPLAFSIRSAVFRNSVMSQDKIIVMILRLSVLDGLQT